MSGQDNIYLGTIGLLGEYCPTSKKKFRHTLVRVGCMHLELFQNLAILEGCNQARPPFDLLDQSSFEDWAPSASVAAAV